MCRYVLKRKRVGAVTEIPISSVGIDIRDKHRSELYATVHISAHSHWNRFINIRRLMRTINIRITKPCMKCFTLSATAITS